MGKTKIKVIFESDTLTPMELMNYIKNNCEDSFIKILGASALDYVGKQTLEDTTT